MEHEYTVVLYEIDKDNEESIILYKAMCMCNDHTHREKSLEGKVEYQVVDKLDVRLSVVKCRRHKPEK